MHEKLRLCFHCCSGTTLAFCDSLLKASPTHLHNGPEVSASVSSCKDPETREVSQVTQVCD